MPLKCADAKAMEEQGFPLELQEAFRKTAEETRAVILSRVPGPATTTLIAAGHDLKGFFIKAKSCDWGPMSGFLCQLPAFNKKGVDGIPHNANKNLDYHKMFCNRLQPPLEGSETKTFRDRVLSVFADHHLVWQEAWSEPLLAASDDSTETIAKLREYLAADDEQILKQLADLVADDSVIFTDDPEARMNSRASNLFKLRLKTTVHELWMLVGDHSPFVPLKLTPPVFEAFKGKQPTDSCRQIGDVTFGFAIHIRAEKFVCCPYVIKGKTEQTSPSDQDRVPDYYELYHGKVLVGDGDQKQFIEVYLENVQDEDGQPVTSGKGKEILLPITNAAKDDPKNEATKLGDLLPEGEQKEHYQAFHDLWEKINAELKLKSDLYQFDENFDFYPIKGIQNYYPPFSGDDAFLNAVTGDYDLFACWPQLPAGGLEDLTRGGEWGAKLETMFSKMASKPYTLQSTCSPNVLVEVIPTFKELKESKDQGSRTDHASFGYVNKFVLLVAGTLNSFAATIANRSLIRNVAFHGDEGGRPGIDDVDYKIAAFVPRSLLAGDAFEKGKTDAGQTDEQARGMFIIINHIDLLTLIKGVKRDCYVPLNFAWLNDFLFYAGQDPEAEDGDVATVRQLLHDIFWAGSADSNRDKLHQVFLQLFLGGQAKITAKEKVDLLAELTLDQEQQGE